MANEIRPFQLEIPRSQLVDLKERLANTRWPERETDGRRWKPRAAAGQTASSA
jgi:hypothetical protein